RNMKSGAPRSSSVARCSSPVASASPIAGSSCGTLLSSAASTSANFLLVSIFTCSTCNICRVMVGSAIALSISVGQFSDKPGQVHFRISRLEPAFQRGLEPVLGPRFAHAVAKEIGIAAEVFDRRERNRIDALLDHDKAGGWKSSDSMRERSDEIAKRFGGQRSIDPAIPFG